MHVCMHTQVDTVATNRYLTVTSLDIFRPLPTHFHPVCSAHTEIRPEYFRFPTFPPFRYPRSLFHPRVLHFHFASPLPSHFALHTRPSNETLRERFFTRSTLLPIFLTSSPCALPHFPFDSRKERIRGIDVFENGSWKRCEHLLWIFFLTPRSGLSYTSSRYIFLRTREADQLAVAFARDTPLRWTNV